MKILQDPSLLDLQDENVATTQTICDPSSIDDLAEKINTTTGKAANVLDRLLAHVARKEGSKNHLQKESTDKFFSLKQRS